MKEMPGAPELPEGWFYRVKTQSKSSSQYVWRVQTRRRVWFVSIPYCDGLVWRNHRGGNVYWDDEEPSLEELASAATYAYERTFPPPQTRTGDYR